MTVAALVDTNVLVYRFDGRFPAKQSRAIELLKRGILDDSVRVPHQAIVEFVAAVSRPTSSGRPILPPMDPSSAGSTPISGPTPSTSGSRSCGRRTSSTIVSMGRSGP